VLSQWGAGGCITRSSASHRWTQQNGVQVCNTVIYLVMYLTLYRKKAARIYFMLYKRQMLNCKSQKYNDERIR